MGKSKGSTPLECAIKVFVAHQRVFGRGYSNQEYILKVLGRFALRSGAADLNATVFDAWCKDQQHISPTTLHARQLVVRKLCLFRRRREPRCFVPDPSGFARPRPHAPPVIVTPTQIAAMLCAADGLAPWRDSPLQAATMRIAVVLLYTAGLRRGELLRLRLADVNTDDGVLHIRESKFHRSRWVPLSRDACRELREYLRKRAKASGDLRPEAPLLCNKNTAHGRTGWHAYCGGGLACGLRRLFDLAGIRDSQGRRPRVHDIRHSYAVETLMRCYRQGGDVQTHLPKIALYMPASTRPTSTRKRTSMRSVPHLKRWTRRPPGDRAGNGSLG